MNLVWNVRVSTCDVPSECKWIDLLPIHTEPGTTWRSEPVTGILSLFHKYPSCYFPSFNEVGPIPVGIRKALTLLLIQWGKNYFYSLTATIAYPSLPNEVGILNTFPNQVSLPLLHWDHTFSSFLITRPETFCMVQGLRSRHQSLLEVGRRLIYKKALKG